MASRGWRPPRAPTAVRVGGGAARAGAGARARGAAAGTAGVEAGEGGGGEVVAVEGRGGGMDDPVGRERGGMGGEGFVLPPQDGALALGIDQDKGLAAGAVGDGDDLGLDAGVGECLAVEGGGD